MIEACTSAPDELEEPKYRLRHFVELGPCASVRCYPEGWGKPRMCSVALEVAAEAVVVAEAVSAGWDVMVVAATPGSDAAYCFALEVYRGISACR